MVGTEVTLERVKMGTLRGTGAMTISSQRASVCTALTHTTLGMAASLLTEPCSQTTASQTSSTMCSGLFHEPQSVSCVSACGCEVPLCDQPPEPTRTILWKQAWNLPFRKETETENKTGFCDGRELHLVTLEAQGPKGWLQFLCPGNLGNQYEV